MELHPSLFCLCFCLLYFFLPPFEDLGCFSGCLMSSAGIQKLFCGIYSAFKCSFDEFVGEKVYSLSYSSAILAPPPIFGYEALIKYMIWNICCQSVNCHLIFLMFLSLQSDVVPLVYFGSCCLCFWCETQILIANTDRKKIT